MFKKITIVAAVALPALFAKADFLYWQVADQGEFSEAVLHVMQGTTEVHVFDGEAALGVNYTDKWTGTATGLVTTDISNYASSEYSFFVEMLTYSDNSFKGTNPSKGYTWSYDELVSSGYVSAGNIATPSMVTGGGLNMGSPVPEPTSGILLLIGGGMLALRRRRQA